MTATRRNILLVVFFTHHSCDCVAYVFVEAEITNRLENVDVKEGDKVVLVCEVTGNPQPLIWWEFRGIEHDPTALPGRSPSSTKY